MIYADGIKDPSNITYDMTNQASPTNLLAGQKVIDPGLAASLNAQFEAYKTNPNKDQEFINSGNAATRNLVPSASQIGSGPVNGSVQMQGLGQALAERSNRQYGTKMQAAQNLSDIESPYQQSQRLSQIGSQYNAIQNIQLTNYKQQMQAYLAEQTAYNAWQKEKNAASDAVLNSILGGIGAIGGAIIGGAIGGPAGAVAGATAGSKI